MLAEDDVDEGGDVGDSDGMIAIDISHAAGGCGTLAEDDVDKGGDVGYGDDTVAIDIAYNLRGEVAGGRGAAVDAGIVDILFGRGA